MSQADVIFGRPCCEPVTARPTDEKAAKTLKYRVVWITNLDRHHVMDDRL